MKQGDYLQTSFCFLKKALNELKEIGLQLCFKIF